VSVIAEILALVPRVAVDGPALSVPDLAIPPDRANFTAAQPLAADLAPRPLLVAPTAEQRGKEQQRENDERDY